MEKYPRRQISSRIWSFQSSWFDKYKWLEYSEELDAFFCFACRHFATTEQRTLSNSFINDGFRRWKKACGKDGSLEVHARSTRHLSSIEKWNSWQSGKSKTCPTDHDSDSEQPGMEPPALKRQKLEEKNSDSEIDPKNLIPELLTQFYWLQWVTGTGGGISIAKDDKLYIAPSGVQKERVQNDDIFVTDRDGNILERPSNSNYRMSQCTPMFMVCYGERNAGACIHTHSIHAVMVTEMNKKEFRIQEQEMIKGIFNGKTKQFHKNSDEIVVPIIENTCNERDLRDSFEAAVLQYPETSAVLVRHHGIYVWGPTWEQAKKLEMAKNDKSEELIVNGKKNGFHVECREEEVVFRPASSDIGPPSDTYRKVFLIFLLHGVGVLLPWNVFINAVSYFKDYKLNTTSSFEAEYRTHFLVYIGMASQIPNILLCAVNVFFQATGDSSKQGIRFIVAIIINITALVITIILALVDSYEWPFGFFVLTVVIVVVLNSCTGVYQSYIFGLAAMLPMSYSNAIIIGNNLCGTLVALCMIITKAAAGAGNSNPSGESLRMGAIYYFAFATAILIACLGTYFVLPRLAFFRYFTHKDKPKKDPLLSKEEAVEMDSNEEEMKQGDSALSVLRNCFGICCFCPMEAGVTACSGYWNKYKEALPYCWMHCLSVFSIFFCTLSAFPALTATVQPVDEGYFIPKQWFTDVTCFLIFNLFAMIGNLISNVFQRPGPKWLFIPVWIRTFFFIPFFMFCNSMPDRRVLPVGFGNDHVYVLGMVIFALTSGYLSSLAMMYASVDAPDHLKSISGMLAAFCLILGVVSGVNFSLLWTKMVEGFTHEAG